MFYVAALLDALAWQPGVHEGQAPSDVKFRRPVKGAQGRDWMHDWTVHNNQRLGSTKSSIYATVPAYDVAAVVKMDLRYLQ
jgi:hypothetical protein